jgi:hypothetical protein
MMAGENQQIQVSIIANVKSLISGLKEAKEAVEGATSGIKGNLGALSEAMGSLGGMAITLGAVGLAIEGIKEAISFTSESIKQTYELAETFESLKVKTGETFENLNVYNATMQLTGGTIQEFASWQRGATMAMRSNADMIVANGIASSQSALMAMPFAEYLKKVIEHTEAVQDPGRKAILIQEYLGRSGLESYNQIRKFVEELEEGKITLDEYGQRVNESGVKAQDAMEKATGRLNIAMQSLRKTLADTFGPAAAWIKDATASLVHWGDMFLQYQTKGYVVNGVKPSGQDGSKKNGEANGAGGEAGSTANGQDRIKEEIQKQQAIREQHSQFLAKMAELDLQTELAANQELLEQHKITTKEKEDLDREAYAKVLQAQLHAFDVQAAAYASDPVKHAAALDQKKLATAKYYADIAKLHDQTAKAESQEDMQAHKMAADAALAAERVNVQNRIQIVKGYYDWLKTQDRATPQQVQEALNMIRKEEQAAADQQRALDRAVAEGKRDAATEGLQASLDAMSDEQAAGLITKQQLIQQEMAFEQRMFAIKLQEARDAAMAEPDPVKHQQALNKIEALERQHQSKMGQLERQGAADRRATFNTWFQGITSGFQNAIMGLIKGTMTWGDAFRSILASMAEFLIQKSTEMVMQWVADRVYEMIFGKTTRSADVLGAASVYAVNAMASVAAIPMVGWAMAPGVGAAAFAQGLAYLPSAAQGWERVPQDTMAMIHKDEQVLPAEYAQGLRDLVKGGGGAREVHNHHYTIQAMDAQSFDTFLRRNQGTLVKVSNEAMRNRRTTR